MSKAYEFIKECRSFFVLTINKDFPAGRPFGAIMEIGEDLYIATNDMNQAHRQLRENGNIQIIAQKPDSRQWIRVTGVAVECDSKELQNKMYNETPSLHRVYPNGLNDHFIMFKVSVKNVEIK